MLIIQLHNGKTVFKSFEEWLDMTPEEYQDLIASNEGIDIEDPFDRSLDRIKDPIQYDLDIPDLPSDIEDISGK